MNKRGPNRRPRSSLPRAPARLLGSQRIIFRWLSLSRPYFDLLSHGEAIRDKPAQYISMRARVTVRVIPNMEALPCLQIYVTVPGKNDHFVIISDFDMLIPCSLIACNACAGGFMCTPTCHLECRLCKHPLSSGCRCCSPPASTLG